MKKIGVVLSGCGFRDGSEIHESVFTLLAIDQAGCEAVCIAPNLDFEEIDSITGKPTGRFRNAYLESARISRGKIIDLAKVDASTLDALILPGGYGAAKNLSNFATKGAKAEVLPALSKLVLEMMASKKPIGAICIAPAAIAAILSDKHHPDLTIGNDVETAHLLEKMGAKHQNCAVDDIIIDKTNRIVSTPAYMLATRVSEVWVGIEKLVRALLQLMPVAH